MNKNKKRDAPPSVEPLEHNCIRYEVEHWGKTKGLKQNGGYIAAVDIANNEQIKWIQIYKIKYSWWGKEDDKQDIFINEISLDKLKNKLIITDEKGRIFHLDLLTSNVDEI